MPAVRKNLPILLPDWGRPGCECIVNGIHRRVAKQRLKGAPSGRELVNEQLYLRTFPTPRRPCPTATSSSGNHHWALHGRFEFAAGHHEAGSSFLVANGQHTALRTTLANQSDNNQSTGMRQSGGTKSVAVTGALPSLSNSARQFRCGRATGRNVNSSVIASTPSHPATRTVNSQGQLGPSSESPRFSA